MKNKLLWRGLLILAVATLAIVSAYPLKENLKLGLDLRGGIHLVLQVEVEDAVRSERTKDLDRLIQELRDAGLTAVSAEPDADSSASFVVSGVPRDKDSAVGGIVSEYLPGWSWNRRGEDLEFDIRGEDIETDTSADNWRVGAQIGMMF